MLFSPSKSFGRKGWRFGVVRCWSRRSLAPCMLQTADELLPVVVLVLPNNELATDMFVPHISPAELVFGKPWDDPTRVDEEEVIPLFEGVLPLVGVRVCWGWVLSPTLDKKVMASWSEIAIAWIVVLPRGQLFNVFWA